MRLGKRATSKYIGRLWTEPSQSGLSRFCLRKTAQLFAAALTTAALAGCAQSPVHTSRYYPPASSHQAYLPLTHQAYVPMIEKRHHHHVASVETTGSLPRSAAVGVASFYTEGARTASGERLNPNALTAAHPSLPFGTRLRITSVADGRSVVVRVNDRGPFIKGRAVDVSYSAAKQLGLTERGVAKVKMEVIQ
jgi:rare lipoprotein A